MENERSLFIAIFGQIEDPRVERNKEHRLLDIIALAICAAICFNTGMVVCSLIPGKSAIASKIFVNRSWHSLVIYLSEFAVSSITW